MCAQPAPESSGILPDNTETSTPPEGPTTPEGPTRQRPRITPIQWVGLTVLILLFLYQGGFLQSGGLDASIAGIVDQLPFFIAIILAVTFHEFSHARIATWFGDDLPRRTGRLTLNPLAHLDPMGSLLFLVAHFGWGKPVQINPSAMRNPNLGWALSSAAGPVSNLFTAAVVIAIVQALGRPGDAFTNQIVIQFVSISVTLAIFNLIPLPPLDGFGFVFGLAPRAIKIAMLPLQRYGPMILLALLFLPSLFRGFPPVLQVLLAAGSRLFFGLLGVSPRDL